MREQLEQFKTKKFEIFQFDEKEIMNETHLCCNLYICGCVNSCVGHGLYKCTKYIPFQKKDLIFWHFAVGLIVQRDAEREMMSARLRFSLELSETLLSLDTEGRCHTRLEDVDHRSILLVDNYASQKEKSRLLYNPPLIGQLF